MKSHDHTVYSILSNGKKVPMIRLSNAIGYSPTEMASSHWHRWGRARER